LNVIWSCRHIFKLHKLNGNINDNGRI
jgi:hypothetical protein